MSVCSSATCYWFIDWGNENKQLTFHHYCFSPPVTEHLVLARCISPIHLTHLCLHRSRWMDTVPRLPVNSLSLPALSYGVGGSGWWLSEGGVKVDERCVVLVWPTSFHPRQAAGAVGCGRGGSRVWLNDRALFGAWVLIRLGPSQTIVGVTGPQRPRVRGLMSQYWAERSRPVWSAAAGSDGSDRASQSRHATSKHLVHNINCYVLRKGILFVAVEQLSQNGKDM